MDSRLPLGLSSKFEPLNKSARKLAIFSFSSERLFALARSTPPSICFNSECVILATDVNDGGGLLGFSHAARRVSNSLASSL